MELADRLVPAHSRLDTSVNWVADGSPGRIETRYVRRRADVVVVYLSTQTGCRQACRMCHLTATGQTALRDLLPAEVHAQADVVLRHYGGQERALTVHFNFMARGEPLASRVLVADGDAMLGPLADRATRLGLLPRWLVSTILPREFGDRPLEEVFVRHQPELYYSIYSMDPTFRRRWLPKALPAEEGLDRLVRWQRHSSKPCKLHYAFIAGENDAEADVHAICDAVEQRGLRVHVNVVRFNPVPGGPHVEPPEEVVQRNASIFRTRLREARVQIVARVGFDVAASCGMFVGGGPGVEPRR